ncbi:MAG: heme biosynthesis HemY N-terminal domain-containing protein [Gammaproteobacteria bacterium]|jgi:HemY protein
MRWGLLLLVALALGALGAHWLLGDQGYVLIDVRGWTVETSVPGLVIALLLLYVAVRLLIWLFRAPRRMGQTVGEYRARRSQRRLDQAFAAIAEGQWGRGERLLGRAARGPASLAGYLSAARAAQEQNAVDRRDEWLRLAYEADPDATPAVLLTQAELQLDSGQLEEAVATLRRLEETSPSHPRGLTLQARALEQLGDWGALDALLPRLRSARVLETETLEQLEIRTACARLEGAADAAALEAAWKSLARKLRQRPALIESYAGSAVRLGLPGEAETMLRKALKTAWAPSLVNLYGRLETTDPAKQLAMLEKWLAQRPEDAELLLACGRLCLKNELWGKARSYLETSLAIRPLPESWRIYGELLTQLGESGAASEAFRKGLAAAAGDTPALAPPRAGAA